MDYYNQLAPSVRAINAQKRFGKYKKEEPAGIRSFEAGNEQEQLRRKREMLRSMSPDLAIQVIEFHKRVSILEASALAKKEGKLIVPNSVHDKILETADQTYLKKYQAISGTAIIYEAPDTGFGKTLIYNNSMSGSERIQKLTESTVSFKVPVRFRGIKNCALIVEHPDFEMVSLGDKNYEFRVPDDDSFNLLENFPGTDKTCHRPDELFGIPVGPEVDEADTRTRRIWRAKGEGIGLVVRSTLDLDRHDVATSALWINHGQLALF